MIFMNQLITAIDIKVLLKREQYEKDYQAFASAFA